MEDMLRAYVSFQNDWDEYLIPAGFAYNNSVQASTGFTPFYLNHGRHPHTPLSLLMGDNSPSDKDNNPAANEFVGRFSENLARAKDALHRAQQRQQKYANQHRRDAKFSVGDEVLLSTKILNLHLPEGATPKLYPKYTGPLKVLEVISPVAYKLKLPPTMKCHNIFHISLLKPADFFSDEFPERIQHAPPPVRVENNQAYFSVDFIMGRKPRTAKCHAETKRYLIKWAGYPAWENTEELAQNIAEDVPEEVALYWERLSRNPKPRASTHNSARQPTSVQSPVSVSPPVEAPQAPVQRQTRAPPTTPAALSSPSPGLRKSARQTKKPARLS